MDLERTETVIVRGGSGRLALLQGRRDTALTADGSPVSMVWQDPDDVDHCWFVRAHDLSQIDELVAPPLVGDDTHLAEVLRPVLDLLGDGRYELEHTGVPDVQADLPHSYERPRSSGRLIDWAGIHRVESGDALLVGTVPRDLLDRGTIATLADNIRAGARPAVVALGSMSGEASFIIVGHAVLEAYRRVGLPPNLVHVDAYEPPYLSPDAGADLLVRAYRRVGDVAAAHYRAVRAARESREIKLTTA